MEDGYKTEVIIVAKTIIITPLVSYCILDLNLVIAYLAFIVKLRIVLKNPLNTLIHSINGC